MRDCSRKQKAQYQIRGKSGKPVTNTIPYGFKKDPDEKHHWLVDEEAADVVRRIFHLSAEGKGPQTIAKILMNDKIERPSYYLARQGWGTCQRKTDMSRPYDWTGNTIADMLAKPEYMGHTVNFRAYKPSYKDKRMIKRPPEEWLIFENTHEAIVDPETWKLAQRSRQEVDIYLKFIGKFDVPIPEPTPEELAEQEKLRKKREKQREYSRRSREKKKRAVTQS